MESLSLKRPNIVIDCKLKESKYLPSNMNKTGKNKIKKIKYIYMDSSEKTKDETFNKFEKNNEHKNLSLKQNNFNKNKKRFILNNHLKKIKPNKYILNDENNTCIELNLDNIKNNYKFNNFKYFNKKNFDYLLEWRAKTLDKSEGKKYKIRLNILNQKNLDKKDNSTKAKTNFNLSSFNEEDLANKIKNINYGRFITSCYKNLKIRTEGENKFIDNHGITKYYKVKKNLKTNNIFCCKKTNIDKNIINSAQSKMKAYTKMPEKIKNNIIEKTNKKVQPKKNIKKIPQKIKEFKSNKKIHFNDKFGYKNDSNNLTNYNSEINNINLNSKEMNSEENFDLLDIPQRRPGLSAKRNSKREIFIDISSKNEKDIKIHERMRKSEYLIGLQPRTTFTKALKRIKDLNNINAKREKKEKSNLTSKLISSIIKKFKTQKFNIESYNKNLIKKRNKGLDIKYDINFINIQDSYNKPIEKKNNEMSKDLNSALIETNKKDYSTRRHSLKNSSFYRDFNNTFDYKKKISKNSVIKKINNYIKNEKILTNNYKKSYTAFQNLPNRINENRKEKNKSENI